MKRYLQGMFLDMVRSYVGIALWFYFRKIEVKGQQFIPKDKGVLFLSNHHNALIDALLHGVYNTRSTYFLTRASVFKNTSVATLLTLVQMLPVYRMRNGIKSIRKNIAIFQRCADILAQKGAVMLFPEGNHGLKRTVRPLTKGFTRIIDMYFKRHSSDSLIIIPNGLSYQNPTEYGSDVLIQFGPQIIVKKQDLENTSEFIQSIRSKISELTIDLAEELPPLPSEEQEYDYLDIEKFQSSTSIGDLPIRKKHNHSKILKIIHYGLHPLSLAIWYYIMKPKIAEDEFVSTIRFAVSGGIAPLLTLITSVIIGLVWGGCIGFFYFILNIFVAMLYVKI